MATQWYVMVLGTQRGPFTAVQVKQYVEQGAIKLETLVKNSPDGNWQPASRWGLFADQPSNDERRSLTPQVTNPAPETALIHFSCPHCGAQFKISKQFAGRRANCKTCRAAVVIPCAAKGDVVAGDPSKGPRRETGNLARPSPTAPSMPETRRSQSEPPRAAGEAIIYPLPPPPVQQAPYIGPPYAAPPAAPHLSAANSSYPAQVQPVAHPNAVPVPVAYYAPQQQVVIQNVVSQATHVSVRRPRKDVGTAVFLAFCFGPFGMFYSTVPGALVMLLLNFALAWPTLGMIGFVTWPIGCVWAAIAASNDRG